MDGFSQEGPLAAYDQAIATVNDKRGATYGHPSTNFDRIARMAEQIASCRHPLVRHALYMILVNVARLVESPEYADGPIDIAGYARTIAMVLDREAKSAPRSPYFRPEDPT